MKKQNDILENLLHESFDNYTTPEYKNTWTILKQKLVKHYFLKFNIAKLNIYYAVAFIGSVAGIIAYTGSPKQVKSVESEHVKIETLTNSTPVVVGADTIVQQDTLKPEKKENEKNNTKKISTATYNFDTPQSQKKKSFTNKKATEKHAVPEKEEQTSATDSLAVATNQENKPNTQEQALSLTDTSLVQNTDTNVKTVKKVVYVPQKKVVVRDTIVKKVQKEKRVRK